MLRVNRLRTAILSNSINEIGKFKTVERLVNLNADRKRQWFEKLTDINDKKMIDSLPLSLSFLAKESLWSKSYFILYKQGVNYLCVKLMRKN